MSVSARDRAYAELFGSPQYQSYPDLHEGLPQIEVRRYALKTPGGEWDVWATSGMSDVPMRDANSDELRRELVFYAARGGDFSVALRAVARFPFEEHTYLMLGHTVQVFGSLFLPGGAAALASGKMDAIELPHVFLTGTIIKRHQQLPALLVIDGCPVDFLWVVPVSQAELEYKKEKGTQALLDLFDEHEHSWLFDPERVSYVE